MKTVNQYEDADIDIEENPLHASIGGALMVAFIIMAASGKNSGNEDELRRSIKTGVMLILNAIDGHVTINDFPVDTVPRNLSILN